MADGWIKLHRSLLEWEWYADLNTKSLFIHLLITANYSDIKWREIELKRGSRIVSYAGLSEETGISVQSIRTSMNRLKSTGNLTTSKIGKYTVASIVNYEKFQELTSNLTSCQQDANKMLTRCQQRYKKERNKEGKNIYPPTPQGDGECERGTSKNLFEIFWEAYPKKKRREKAEREFNKLELDDLTEVLNAIDVLKKTKQWKQDDGYYIPLPENFLLKMLWKETGQENKNHTSYDLDAFKKQVKNKTLVYERKNN